MHRYRPLLEGKAELSLVPSPNSEHPSLGNPEVSMHLLCPPRNLHSKKNNKMVLSFCECKYNIMKWWTNNSNKSCNRHKRADSSCSLGQVVRSHISKSERGFVLKETEACWALPKEPPWTSVTWPAGGLPLWLTTNTTKSKIVVWKVFWSIFLSSLASCTGWHPCRTGLFATSGAISDFSHCLRVHCSAHLQVLNWGISRDLVWGLVFPASTLGSIYQGQHTRWEVCKVIFHPRLWRLGGHSNGLKITTTLIFSSDSCVVGWGSSLSQMWQIRSIRLGKNRRRKFLPRRS